MKSFVAATALATTAALLIAASSPVHATESTTALEFTDAPCCTSQPEDQICFFEEPEYNGRCACSGLEPTFEDIKLGNGGAYGSVRLPGSEKLVLNVFKDDYVRNTKSFEVSSATGGIARRFAVGKRDSVCLYTKANFHGEKLCVLPGGKRHHCVDGFASVLFFPTTNPHVQADIKDDQCRSASAGLLGNETERDRRRFDVTLTYVTATSQKQSDER
ncbi:hypothetical protein Gpo141_00001678 [Globisporangium polare]